MASRALHESRRRLGPAAVTWQRRQNANPAPTHSLIVRDYLRAPLLRQEDAAPPPRDLTLDWYRLLFADEAIWTSVLNSLLVAVAAMAISLVLGIPAALALDRANFSGKGLLRRLVLLPLILPGIITGLSLLMLFGEANVKLGLLTIILGHGTALISVATRKYSPVCKNSIVRKKKRPWTWAPTAGRPSGG